MIYFRFIRIFILHTENIESLKSGNLFYTTDVIFFILDL